MGLEFATRSDTDHSEWAAVPARGQPWTSAVGAVCAAGVRAEPVDGLEAEPAAERARGRTLSGARWLSVAGERSGGVGAGPAGL
jgi:hypothetical protein